MKTEQIFQEFEQRLEKEYYAQLASKKRKILKQFKINLLFAWMRAKIGHCVMNEKRV